MARQSPPHLLGGGQSYDIERRYEYRFEWGNVEEEGDLVFMQSANIGTVYIETESNSMEQIDQDKEYQEAGLILVKDPAGETCYGGLLSSIKSRGNATWNTEKKSYAIKLSKEADLFEMGEGKNWILLSNVYDGNKLQNKLCLDMAADIGLAYTPESEWVDLYLNGQYMGNYLLCEKIEIGENRIHIAELEEPTKQLNGDLQGMERFDTQTQRGILAEKNPEDITGGYLIEKDSYYDSVSGFMTEEENGFSIKSPQYATKEQVDYIADYVQQIEDLVLSGQEEAFAYLDLDSLVSRYLLDEVVLNYDFGVTSMYFYKDMGDPKLYAGPVWDYDGCMGAGVFNNPKVLAALEIQDHRREKSLTWYPYLYENQIFYDAVVQRYHSQVRPYILSLIEDGGKIDQYAEIIRPSIRQDIIRWPYGEYGAGHYESFDNNVRYIKYFLGKRLRFLDKQWLGEDNRYDLENKEIQHTVTFQSDLGTERILILDGEGVLDTPEHLLKAGEWWYNERNQRALYPDIPVYEDVAYYAWDGC